MMVTGHMWLYDFKFIKIKLNKNSVFKSHQPHFKWPTVKHKFIILWFGGGGIRSLKRLSVGQNQGF